MLVGHAMIHPMHVRAGIYIHSVVTWSRCMQHFGRGVDAACSMLKCTGMYLVSTCITIIWMLLLVGTASEVRAPLKARRAMVMAMGFCPAIWLPCCTGARRFNIELTSWDVGLGLLRATSQI